MDPIELTVNGETRSCPAPITVAGLVETLGLAGRAVAVEVNGEVVPRREHEARTLTGGDRVELITLVGGG